jgi:hypothetical protein
MTRSPRDIEEMRQRVVFAPDERMRSITAGVLMIGLLAGVEMSMSGRLGRVYMGDELDLPDLEPTPVPEHDEIELSKRRAMLRRIEAQRAARSQRAASGGSVSSADAGRPSHGSSDATTDP